jgi:hypothetical protein
MKAGRNDPCPCGSGKKYKNCCLANDRERRVENRLEPPPVAWDETDEPYDGAAAESPRWRDGGFDPELTGARSGESHPLSDDDEDDEWGDEPGAEPEPLRQAGDDLWDEFDRATYEGKNTLFLKTLETPDLLADDLGFEMLNAIRRRAQELGDWDAFEILLRAFQERAPEAFADSAAYCVAWLVEQRVACGRLDELGPLAREMAGYAGSDIDIFNLALDSLAYHCDLPTLVEMMRIGWPGVRDSSDIVPWGVDEFIDRAMRYELLQYCEQAASPRADDPELVERLEFYAAPFNEELAAAFIESVTGRVQQGPVPGTARGKWCHRVCCEFLGHLVRERGVRPGKADLGSENLCTYLLQRLEGQLKHAPKLYDPGQRLPKRKGRSRRVQRRPVHVLCPDAKTLDPYLAHQMDFLAARYHAVAATMEIIPAWLRFLNLRQLIDPQEHRVALQDLSRLQSHVLKFCREYRDDPSLHEAAVQAWQEPLPSPQQT